MDFVSQLAGFAWAEKFCPLDRATRQCYDDIIEELRRDFIIVQYITITCLEKITLDNGALQFNYLSPESFPTTLLLPVCNSCWKSNKQLNYSKNLPHAMYFCHRKLFYVVHDCDVDATALLARALLGTVKELH